MLTIEVYGPGCANCRMLEKIAGQALALAGVQGEIRKVIDARAIADAGVLRTPGLAINGKLLSSGRIPAPHTVAQWIRESQA